MRRILIPLLALALLCTGLTALAEESEAVSVQVNTAKLSVYEAGDPWLDGLLAARGLAAYFGWRRVRCVPALGGDGALRLRLSASARLGTLCWAAAR